MGAGQKVVSCGCGQAAGSQHNWRFDGEASRGAGDGEWDCSRAGWRAACVLQDIGGRMMVVK